MIIQSFNRIEPDKAAEERMLDAILKKNHSYAYTGRKTQYRIPRFAAVMAVLICLSGITAAAAQQGIFRDLFTFGHTVTGTAYENADDEIIVSAEAEPLNLTVTAEPVDITAVPYSEITEWKITKCSLADQTGTVIDEDMQTDWAPCIDGTVRIIIPVSNLQPGSYRLTVTEFTGRKKADQPLSISGTWVCEISY